jgi:hypothetical protein
VRARRNPKLHPLHRVVSEACELRHSLDRPTTRISYTQVLSTSKDLKTSACCAAGKPHPVLVRIAPPSQPLPRRGGRLYHHAALLPHEQSQAPALRRKAAPSSPRYFSPRPPGITSQNLEARPCCSSRGSLKSPIVLARHKTLRHQSPDLPSLSFPFLPLLSAISARDP